MSQADFPDSTNPSRSKHPDSGVLGIVASWRVSRQRAALAWAEGDQKTLFGTLPGVANEDAPSADLDMMYQMQNALADWTPKTIRGAREMLGVVLDILAASTARPDSTLAQGPILDIVRQVADALDCRNSEMLLDGKSEPNILQ